MSDDGYGGNGPEPEHVQPPPGYWGTQDGRMSPIAKMEDSHLLNTLRAMRAGTVAGKDTFLESQLIAEVRCRRLEMLPDFASKEEAHATAAVSKLYLHWKRLTPRQAEALVPAIRAYLHDDWVPSEEEIANGPTLGSSEFFILKALRNFALLGAMVDDDAQLRLAESFSRWTVAMNIDERVA